MATGRENQHGTTADLSAPGREFAQIRRMLLEMNNSFKYSHSEPVPFPTTTVDLKAIFDSLIFDSLDRKHFVAYFMAEDSRSRL